MLENMYMMAYSSSFPEMVHEITKLHNQNLSETAEQLKQEADQLSIKKNRLRYRWFERR